MQEIHDTLYELCKLNIIKCVFSMPYSKQNCYRKCVVKKLSEKQFQFERFTDKQAFHENVLQENLCEKLCECLKDQFQQLQLFTPDYIYSLKITSKGRLLQSRCKNQQTVKNSTPQAHNKEKNYIITFENAPPVFKDLGIMSKDGKIISSMYDKYRQICRFIELIDDVVSKDSRQEYNIVDFGCGKSYLTFVVYHYMSVIMGKKVTVTGLDLKKDVMDKCTQISKKYGYTGMEFLCMDIKDYCPKTRPDMVIALHACDIATDYALYNAYLWQADYIFSVPCCQHELNNIVKSENYSLLCEYGIIKERFSAIATDALRAQLLKICGYDVDLIEFINEEFSPKNLLIRAKRTTKISYNKRKALKEKIECFDNEFNSVLTLEKLVFKDIKSLKKDESEYVVCYGMASMLLKDVVGLRKKECVVPVRTNDDENIKHVCVYKNDKAVFCATVSDSKNIDNTIFSTDLSCEERENIIEFI